MPEQTHAEEQADAAHLARVDECMDEMTKNGFIKYTNKNTGEIEKLTFETVISEGIDDADGFISAMLGFYQTYKLKNGTSIESFVGGIDTFYDKIEQLLTTYIEGDVIACEEAQENTEEHF